jgi:hypothetical protein
MEAATKDSPTAIGPELRSSAVKVWLDGIPERIVQFSSAPCTQQPYLTSSNSRVWLELPASNR